MSTIPTQPEMPDENTPSLIVDGDWSWERQGHPSEWQFTGPGDVTWQAVSPVSNVMYRIHRYLLPESAVYHYRLTYDKGQAWLSLMVFCDSTDMSLCLSQAHAYDSALGKIKGGEKIDSASAKLHGHAAYVSLGDGLMDVQSDMNNIAFRAVEIQNECALGEFDGRDVNEVMFKLFEDVQRMAESIEKLRLAVAGLHVTIDDD